MGSTELRELRQHASELVRRAERGETLTVTVSGREVAQLGPLDRRQWRTWEEIRGVFDDGADTEWASDRELLAATAAAHGARLLTRNPADLRGLDEVLDIVSV